MLPVSLDFPDKYPEEIEDDVTISYHSCTFHIHGTRFGFRRSMPITLLVCR
jgi:hypothetical protein